MTNNRRFWKQSSIEMLVDIAHDIGQMVHIGISTNGDYYTNIDGVEVCKPAGILSSAAGYGKTVNDAAKEYIKIIQGNKIKINNSEYILLGKFTE